MNRLAISTIVAVLVISAPALLKAAIKPDSKASPAPEVSPAADLVTALDVQPAKIVISSKFESTQVIVTAKLTTGDRVDVTRLATLKVGNDVAEVTPQGQVVPLRNGSGTLHVELAGHKTEIPIEIGEMEGPPKVDFIRDVNPVLTKIGCNAGTCHGAKDGKVGFKLSLRGYDPVYDVRSLKDDLAGRRLNVASPDDSLMLLKATAGVPHEGGQVTKVGDKYYEILRAWIEDGARLDLAVPRVTGIEVFPKDPVVQQIGAMQQVRIVASYSDGKKRDVTAEAFVESGNGDVVKTDGGGLVQTLRRGEAPLLARYEGTYAATTVTVMGDRSGFTWQQPETWSRVDELVAAKWQRMKIQPSGLCSDSDFLRRVSLDLTGLPPNAEEVRTFLADPQPSREKRDALVEKLIGSPEYVEHWTNKWADMLQVNSKFLGGEGAKLFREWIRKEVEANTPYDQFVRKIVTATGSNKENPAASYWKILREPTEALENTTHLFLATRFNCNKCHDHPFERWTQDQYYELGAYFSQVQLEPDPASGAAKIVGSAVEQARPLFEIVKDMPQGDLIHERTNKVAQPKFPFPIGPKIAGTRREQLVTWITSVDNRFFATSYVNRLWGYLTGVGIVEPLDDMRAGNPPSNPELLEYLRSEFVSHNFDVRHILRLITKSRTYQLEIGTNRWNEDDRTNYSHALARRLPAEVLYDSILKVTGSATKLPGGTRANQLPDAGLDLPSGFLANLGRPARESSCECERSDELRLGSVMALLSGPAVADAIGDESNALAKLAAAQPDDRRLVDELFTQVLNRPARNNEVDVTLQSWSKIAEQHTKLIAERDAKEHEQAPLIAQAEGERLARIEAANAELSRYEAEIAPRIAEADKKRADELAAAQVSMKEYEEKELAKTHAAFESSVPASRTYTGWMPLELVEVRASNGVILEKQADGSVLASGPKPKNTDYVLKADTKLAGITGILLEVLPTANEPGYGPGRAADGNFVLGEFSVRTGPQSGQTPTEAKFLRAVSDFDQTNFEASKAIDGKRGDGANGWAISQQFGVPHLAAFQFINPIGDAEKGIRLRLEMNHPREGGFAIARFRVWVTTSATVGLGLPAPVAEALKKPAASRSAEEQTAVASYWKESDPELLKRRLNSDRLTLPLPIDPGILERRAAIAKAEEPITLDARLVQLRQDVQQSEAQLAASRLTGVQDLTWALINTAAFLFNH